MRLSLVFPVFVAAVLASADSLKAQTVSIILPPHAAPRVEFGALRVKDALEDDVGVRALLERKQQVDAGRIVIGTVNDPAVSELIHGRQVSFSGGLPQREGFTLATCSNGVIAVVGGDSSGVLYGCLELATRIRKSGKLPAGLHFTDAPAFILRGPCIGMQKPFILPGHKVYEYPYTPELFPFFYDKTFWTEYLDFLVENRMNSLYLWNGHPFASLVRLQDYPYATEVPDDILQKNIDTFRFIAREADKRGIWLVQMFYSIILSKPFADHHGIPTQLSSPAPVACDYMRKSIAEFVKQYPNVGLMVCLGEALQGQSNQVFWCTNVVLEGVKSGMRAAHLSAQPPVVIRTHATDARIVMPAALSVYTNLYTEAKYNGESLTTSEPRGTRQALHQAMGKLGSTHLINVHILANLEPFRYGDQRFIQKCVAAGRDRLGARGVHLYPLSYWNWPYSPDKTDPPLKQWKRDWIWFESWARYAWNPDVSPDEDRGYWIARITELYGNTNAAEFILDAYNYSGECAPRLLRRFGITEGNRQTLSLGMTLDQIVAPAKYSPFPELWESQSPPGERLAEYVKKEWNGEPHEGETPPQIIAESLDYAKRAVDAIEKAAPLVSKNRDEFERLRNDMRCIQAMTGCYAAKVAAALHVLRYEQSHDLRDLEHAAARLQTSLDGYRRLVSRTETSYHFANSMQTSQRKIPFPGGVNGMATNYHWRQLVGQYQAELDQFQSKVARLEADGLTDSPPARPLPSAKFKLLSDHAETYVVTTDARVFTDRDYAIQTLAPEVRGLTGIRFSHEAAKSGQLTAIEFEAAEPLQVLVGYFRSKESTWLQVPNLETAAHADDRGGLETVIQNAVTIGSLPDVDVHAFRYGVGRHKLDLIGTGSFLILGFVPQTTKIVPRDAAITHSL